MQKVYADALELSEDEQVELLLMLTKQTDISFATPEIEQAWVRECARRVKLHKAGKTTDVPAEALLTELGKIAAR
ncbi:MAG: addiction module protein [Gammaproteobacteria bacterium]